MANSVSSLSIDQLKKAVQIKEQITALEIQLANLLEGRSGGGATPATRGGMSAAARAKIAAAQRARWARVKGTTASTKPAAAASKPGPRKMSAAARAKIAAAARARWARVKAGK